MIHPTGLIYLTTLIVAIDFIKAWFIQPADSIQSLILDLNYRFLIALFTCIRWYCRIRRIRLAGGGPMLMYAGLLLPLFYGQHGHCEDKNAMIFTRLAMNWVLSGVHIFDGLRSNSTFNAILCTVFHEYARIPHTAAHWLECVCLNSKVGFYQKEATIDCNTSVVWYRL